MDVLSRRFFWLFCTLSTLLISGVAQAQNVQISYPRPGDAVRGEITVRFSGIPDGGYAVIKVDGNFVTATSQNTFVLNTFPPTFPGDGTHRISVTGINAGGKAVGTSEVSFEVANNRIDVSAGSTTLTHWVTSDVLDPNVQRYRVFAQSDASIEGGGATGGGGAGGGGAGGETGEEWIPAPLDWQVSALMRRVVRDVGMFSDDKGEGTTSANVRTVVQTAFQRQRKSESGSGEGAGGNERQGAVRRKKKSSGPTKAPWKDEWEAAPETGQYFVKMIEPSGREINATRKAPTIALADLLPTFPTSPVSPGSTWETRMTFLGELSSREPVNVSVPITFTAFETITTPAGFERRAAKLESRFQMPEQLAKRIAVNLILQGGSAAGGGAGGGGGGMVGGAEGGEGSSGATTARELHPEDLAEYLASITTIRTNTSRVLWFDVERRRVLRSEDTMRTYFEYEQLEGGEGGGAAGGGGAGGEAAEAEPSKISYTMTVTTWYDDSVPPPTDRYTGGAGTAHARDNAQDPTAERISKPVAP